MASTVPTLSTFLLRHSPLPPFVLGIMDYGVAAVPISSQPQLLLAEEPSPADLQPFVRPPDIFPPCDNACRPTVAAPRVYYHSQPIFPTSSSMETQRQQQQPPTSPQDIPVDESYRYTLSSGALTSEQLSSLARHMEEEQQRRLQLQQQMTNSASLVSHCTLQGVGAERVFQLAMVVV